MRNNTIFLFTSFFFLVFQGYAFPANQVCLRQACFSVDIANTNEERAKGLMFRQGLEEGKGMFFLFEDEDTHPFWMKNMAFSIDIIWLDKDNRVVYIETNVPPCRKDPCPVYTPSQKARYVLEIPSGSVAKNGIILGDVAK